MAVFVKGNLYTPDMDRLDAARATYTAAEAAWHQAQRAWWQSVADALAEHGATKVARHLGITRVRVYQIAAQADH